MAGNGQDDFEAIARRYWSAWGDSLRAAAGGQGSAPGFAGMAGAPDGGMFGAPGMFGTMPGAFGVPGGPFGSAQPPAAQAWRDGMDWWARAARGAGSTDDAMGRFSGQAQDWFGRMQQVAAQFAGREGKPADIVQAWKDALGNIGQNPFAGMLQSAQDGQGFDAWMQAAAPLLASLRDDARGWLAVPGFGVGREHQERLQRLVQAQLDHQQHAAAFNALLQASSQQAYAIFEDRIAGRDGPDQQIRSTRALFDLWIEAAEEAYAKSALSPEFRDAYGRMVNAQMRLRGAVQGEIEQVTGQLGMPTRGELDGAHRKIAELERAMQRLRKSQPSARAPLQPAPRAGSRGGDRPKAVEAVAPRRARPADTDARKPSKAGASRASLAKSGPARARAAPVSKAASAAGKRSGTAATGSGRRAKPAVFSRTIPAAPAPLAASVKSSGKKGKR